MFKRDDKRKFSIHKFLTKLNVAGSVIFCRIFGFENSRKFKTEVKSVSKSKGPTLIKKYKIESNYKKMRIMRFMNQVK